MDHPGPENLDPAFLLARATSGAAAEETIDGHVDPRLDELEKVAPKTDLPLAPEQAFRELEQRPFEVSERQAEVEARWDAMVVENYAKAKALAEEAAGM